MGGTYSCLCQDYKDVKIELKNLISSDSENNSAIKIATKKHNILYEKIKQIDKSLGCFSIPGGNYNKAISLKQ